MVIGDSKGYIRALLYSYYITIAWWGVLLRYEGGKDGYNVSKYGTPPCIGTPEKVIWVSIGNHEKAFFFAGGGGGEGVGRF